MATAVRIRKNTPRINKIVRPQPLVLQQIGASGVGRKVTLPFAPVEVSYEGFGLNYATVERPGRKPLLAATTKKLHAINFTVIVANRRSGGTTSVEEILRKIAVMASEDVDVQFVYGVKAFPYRVRITEFQYSTMRRNLEGLITQAEITMTLQERVSVNQSIVALAAIEYEPPRRPSSGGNGGSVVVCPPPCCSDPSSPNYNAYACGKEHHWPGGHYPTAHSDKPWVNPLPDEP